VSDEWRKDEIPFGGAPAGANAGSTAWHDPNVNGKMIPRLAEGSQSIFCLRRKRCVYFLLEC
jgi:hypothetical protein